MRLDAEIGRGEAHIISATLMASLSAACDDGAAAAPVMEREGPGRRCRALLLMRACDRTVGDENAGKAPAVLISADRR